MKFSLSKSIEILEQTPQTLACLLTNLSDDWTLQNEGKDTWSVFDVLGHLIHAEKTDWIPRIEIVLLGKGKKVFEPFDRFAQFETSKGKSLAELLKEFETCRKASLEKLHSFQLTENDFAKNGCHPTLGTVTLSELIAAWVVHDLNHFAQIARVMAKQYQGNVGAFYQYLTILQAVP